MPVIVLPNSKGGAGKTTASFLLATELAQRGLSVSVIDADPNHPIANWKERGGKLDLLTIVQNDKEEKILSDIEREAGNSDFVIVDLEGTASLSVAYAISMADLVIVPSQRSSLDAEEAAKTVALVKRQEQVSKSKIPVALLLTRTNPAIRTRSLNRMIASMENNGIDAFITEITEREAFKAVFDYAKTLSQLQPSQVNAAGLEKARENAAEFAAEVITKLQNKGQGVQKSKSMENVA